MHSDKTVNAAVLAELAWEPMLHAADLGVVVRDGVVTLTGGVDSFWQKRAAKEATARVRGVKGIADAVVVHLPPEARRSDTEIAAAVVHRLGWDGALPAGAVQVHVQDGLVTLTGTVAHGYQRRAAALAVQPLWGVTGLANLVVIAGPPKKPVNPNRIADDIRRALNRGWFAADTVHVEAAGGIVTLSGSAQTLRDRRLAVETAWAAPGTMVVENRIRIG